MPSDALRCTAQTRAGKRCRRWALPGARTCPAHAGTGRQGGRPAKIAPEVVRRIVQVLQAGGYPEAAAAAAGISRRTFDYWLQRGDPDQGDPAEQPYREFRAAVEQARAEAEARNVALIAQAATSNWQAAAWLLERQYPERWARVSQRTQSEVPAAPAELDPFAEVDDLRARRQLKSS